jgi:hypothetical protein
LLSILFLLYSIYRSFFLLLKKVKIN